MTTTPQGSGYYYLGDGRYTRVFPVTVTMKIDRAATTGTFDVPVTVTALPRRTAADGIRPRVRQVQTHTLTVTSTSPLLQPAPDTDRDGFDDLWGTEGTDATNDTADRSTTRRKPVSGTETNKTRRDASPPGDSDAGPVTFGLAAGILLTLAYIVRELV
ncbi:MAG: hypothetical protein ABEK12_01505 [Candidatus Nanohaloarchaea archaeon]